IQTEIYFPTVIQQPSWSDVYSEEKVTLRCEIYGGGGTKWTYEWRPTSRNSPTYSEYRINRVSTSDSGEYSCRKQAMKSLLGKQVRLVFESLIGKLVSLLSYKLKTQQNIETRKKILFILFPIKSLLFLSVGISCMKHFCELLQLASVEVENY
uniref:Ig-like domain-containing protein n=1 Tax=Cyprinodon variegatus TaxID=28743 RepID=A0A3Q2G2M1_CYPVA